MQNLKDTINKYIRQNIKKQNKLNLIISELEKLIKYLDNNNNKLEINETVLKDIIQENQIIFNYIYMILNNMDFLDSVTINNKYFASLINAYNSINNMDFDSGINNYTKDYYLEYISYIERFPMFDKKQEKEITREISMGVKDAKRRLMNANLRLVVYIAKHYENCGMQIMDLIQEGNIGLMKAVDKFDSSKGYKFSTYAVWWIRQTITESIVNQARDIRIPKNMLKTINRINGYQNQLTLELDRNPTQKELAEYTGISEKNLRKIMQISREPISLYTLISEDSHLEELIVNNKNINPEDLVIKNLEKKKIMDVISSLNDKQQFIIKMKYGFYNGKVHTFEEIGKYLKITKQAVQANHKKTLSKIKTQISKTTDL